MIRHAESRAPADRSRTQEVLSPVDTDRLGVFIGCLAHLGPQRQGHGSLIGVTSAVSGEGVTTIAQGLALSAEQSGRAALFVARHFEALPRWLCRSHDDAAAESAAGENAVMSPQHEHSLRSPNGSHEDGKRRELLSDDDLRAWLRGLRNEYEYVFFDLPPVSTGLQPMTSQLDGVVLVVAAQTVQREAARRAVEVLQVSGVPVLGTVLNKRRQYIPQWLYNLI